MKKLDVVTIGSAVRDVLFLTDAAEILNNPKGDPTKQQLIGFEYGAKLHSEAVARYYGGGANNTAVAMSRLGLKVAACVRVGSDADGEATIAHLQSEGVNTQFVQTDPKLPTGFSFLVEETKTHEHVAFVDYGANEQLTIPAAVLQAKPRWFYVSSLSSKRWPQLMKQILGSKVDVAWNPGAIQLAKPAVLKPLLKKVSVLILNRDEATELSGETGTASSLAKTISQLGPQCVVVTDGRYGASVFADGVLYQTKATLRAPKDTTGAGDAFGSSLVAGLIRYRHHVQRALELATVNASAEVSKPGAQHGLLRWSQLPNKLKQR